MMVPGNLVLVRWRMLINKKVLLRENQEAYRRRRTLGWGRGYHVPFLMLAWRVGGTLSWSLSWLGYPLSLPPPCGQTYTCENSTFSHPSDVGGNNFNLHNLLQLATSLSGCLVEITTTKSRATHVVLCTYRCWSHKHGHGKPNFWNPYHNSHRFHERPIF